MSSNLDDDPWVGTKATASATPVPRYVWWGIGGCLVFSALAFGALYFLAHRLADGPETHAVDGDEVPPATVDWLVEKGLLEQDEKLVVFFSSDKLGAESKGSFCTDRRVVDFRDDPEWTVRSVAYADLAKVARRSLNLLKHEVELHLTPREGEALVFVVPMLGFGEPPFETALREAWRASHPAGAFAAQGLWHTEGELPSNLAAELVEKGALVEGEVVLAIFGWERTPLATWGTLCTRERLVCYSFVDPAAGSVWSVSLADIDAFELKHDETESDGKNGLVVRMCGGEESLLEGHPALLRLFEPVLSTAHVEARK